MEFTGDYYKCNKCKHIWDYNDFCCPECGSKEIDDIESHEINEYVSRLIKMLDSHGDYSSKPDDKGCLEQTHINKVLEKQKSINLTNWIVKGDVGISSKTMWAVLQGVSYKGDKPYDPSDFGRCYKFVKECRVSKDDLDDIARALPYWKPYIANWDKLCDMYERNQATDWKKCKEIGMFEYMQKLRDKSDIIKYGKPTVKRIL